MEVNQSESETGSSPSYLLKLRMQGDIYTPLFRMFSWHDTGILYGQDLTRRISPKILMIGWPCIVVYPWLISNLMQKILIYLYIIRLLKSSTCFEYYPAHLQEVYVVIVYMQPLVSSLPAGDYPVHRLRNNSTLSQTMHRTVTCRVTIPEAAYMQLRRRPTEDEQGNARNM
jgi:hypothetical protein